MSANALVVHITILIVLSSVSSCLADNNVCQSVLDKENFDQVSGWTEKGCRLHKYRARDVVQCLDRMHRRRSSDLSMNNLMFYGDSRARNMAVVITDVLIKHSIFLLLGKLLIKTFLSLSLRTTSNVL